MPRPPKPPAAPRPIETLRHADSRRNIPTAEFQSIAQQMEEVAPFKPTHYGRATPLAKGETRERNADLDPQIVWRGMRITLSQAQRKQLQETGEVELGDAQLVWRGKDTQDWSDLVVNPPPIYIQEKVQPKAIIEGIRKESRARADAKSEAPDLFADFNGLDDPEARLEFYQHDQHWSNRMILGDSLQVMASLAERECLRGKVQCIYVDPPYGIKFNSNWQVSTQSPSVKDGKREDISREPEQVKAFRDTWKDGIHSYLTYLRDRMAVARELLTDSGSIFVQIGDENVHRLRALMDEVLGQENYISTIYLQKTGSVTGGFIQSNVDYILCSTRRISRTRNIDLYSSIGPAPLKPANGQKFPLSGMTTVLTRSLLMDSEIPLRAISSLKEIDSIQARIGPGVSRTDLLARVGRSGRIIKQDRMIRMRYFWDDYPVMRQGAFWSDVGGAVGKVYIVQTTPKGDSTLHTYGHGSW